MAVTSVNPGRVTLNLRSYMLLNSLRSTQNGMLRAQNQLASGLRFQLPSDAPMPAIRSLRLDRQIDTLRVVETNLNSANSILRSGESAMQDGIDLVRDAQVLALQAVSDTISGDERRALVSTAQSLLDQLLAVGNREQLDSYLFSGQYGDGPPFELTGEGVTYRGDAGRRQTIVDTDLSEDSFTISGQEFFNAVSGQVSGFADLTPAITLATRLSDLAGATNAGIALGRITVSDGSTSVEIDLSGAATVGDVIDRLNASLPATIGATIGTSGINLNSTGGPVAITVSDVAGGSTAAMLGLLSSTPTPTVFGQNLNATLTPRTPLAALRGGSGIDQAGGLLIRNGSQSARVDLVGAETVEDLLNRLNIPSLGVWARISDDGRRVDLVNRRSGSALTVHEDGGQTATQLGLRSMNESIRLSSLNDGLGIDSIEGADFRITTANGTNVDIDIDQLNLGSGTLGDLIAFINAQAGGAATASLTSGANGILITDQTSGAGTLTITKLNGSAALDGLGLSGVTSSGGTISGSDVNPIIVDSPFSALLELRQGLATDDTRRIQSAGRRLERNLDHLSEVQGRLAAKAEGMQKRSDRIGDEALATQILQSEVRDADLTETIVRFQQLQTALQANLQAAGRIENLSLLDFLR